MASRKTTTIEKPPKVSLADLYAAEPHAPLCKTCEWVQGLDEEDRDWLNNQFRIEDNKTRLWRSCGKAGLKVARSTFVLHFERCVEGN